MEKKSSNSSGKSSSRELLSVRGDGSSRAVIESLFEQPSPAANNDKPQTFKIPRSSLMNQLQSFLPAIQRSNQQLLAQPEEKIKELDIENTDDVDKVVEMNVVVGEMDEGSEEEESTDTNTEDSEDDSPVLGPVTANNLRIPSEARGGNKRRQGLIEEVDGASDESGEDRSDGELTGSSCSSAER